MDASAGSRSSAEKQSLSLEQEKLPNSGQPEETERAESYGQTTVGEFKLYKRRFLGLVGLILLNIVGGMAWPWFGPIANGMVDEFDMSLQRVNWLGNIVACLYLPVALAMPYSISRFGIRRCCDIGAICLILASWIRYAGTPKFLSSDSAYALVIIGQAFAAVAQTIYQVLPAIYSEKWFDLKGRTTATMIASVANPVGGAIGQLLSPLVGDTRQSILVLGIIGTAVTPFVFLVQSSPPTPPTYAGSRTPPSLLQFCKTFMGLDADESISGRDRFDFIILLIAFGIASGAANAFSILTSQFMAPVGYSDDISGFMGATLLLSGIVAAFVTAPLFDRVFTKKLALTTKMFLPILGGAWLSLIWAVKPNNTGGLFAIMAIIGTTSVPLLPVTLELGCDLTRNAEASSSLLWFSCNLFAIIYVIVEDALRAGPDADPPLNMHRAIIFHSTLVMVAAGLIQLIRGKQVRRELDERAMRDALGEAA